MSSGYSKACCTLPPCQATYTPAGAWSSLCGLKTYHSGPSLPSPAVASDSSSSSPQAAVASTAILYIYDIFGFSPQILQGADILASQGHTVLMPDFLGSGVAKAEWFDGSEAGNQARRDFFSGYPGKADTHAEKIRELVRELKGRGAVKVVGVGSCWGYGVFVKSGVAGDDSLPEPTSTSQGVQLDVLVAPSPSFLNPADSTHIDCPTLLLCSQAESQEDCDTLIANLEKKHPGQNELSWFRGSPHGWMAARADLDSEQGRAAFDKGFNEAAAFIKKHTA